MNISYSQRYLENTVASNHSHDDFSTIITTAMIVSIFSTIGSVLILVILAIMRKAAGPFAKLIAMISLSDLIFGIGNILEGFMKVSREDECRILFAFENLGFLSSVFWTNCFAHFVLRNLEDGPQDSINRYFKRYVVTSFSLSIILAAIMFPLQAVAIHEKTQTCWMDFATVDDDWIDIIFMVLPCTISICYCSVVYVFIVRSIKKLGEGIHLEMVVYPSILILCLTPWIVASFYMKITQSEPSDFFVLLTYIFWNSQGLLNAIAYGLSPRTRAYLRSFCTGRTYSGISLENYEIGSRESENNLSVSSSTRNLSFIRADSSLLSK